MDTDTDRINEIFLKEESWKNEAHFMQAHSWMLQYVNNPDYKIYCSFIGGEVSAYSLARIRKIPLLGKLIRIEWGPVAENVNQLKEHLAFIKKSEPGYIHIEISPYLESANSDDLREALLLESFKQRNFRRANYSHTAIVDLTQDLPDIRKGFRASLKTQINKAIRFGVDIKIDDPLDELIEFYNDFAVRKNLQLISTEEQSFLNANRKRSLFLSAYYQNVLVGVIFLLDNYNSIVYQWGASLSTPEYKKIPITHLLHWTGIGLAKELNFNYYDFGGYWKEKGDADSINRFKSGFTKNIRFINDEYVYSNSNIRKNIIEYIVEKRINS